MHRNADNNVFMKVRHQPQQRSGALCLGSEAMQYADNSDDDGGGTTTAAASRRPSLLGADAPHMSNYRRRNSISLPAGLNALEAMGMVTEEVTEASENEESGSATSSDEESYSEGEVLGSEDDQLTVKVPLRSARKKSVMPLPKLRLNDDDLPEIATSGGGGIDSPANSITSINSLSSLLKEKLVMSFPGVLRRKRPREYKLKAFVAILFLCIVFLVGFAYIFYHQQVLQRAYFERIRFNNEERQIRVFNAEGLEVVSGHLGISLNRDAVFRCLPQDELHDGSVCMEWMHRARLYMHYEVFEDVRCYQVTWLSLAHGVHPTDCFDWSRGRGHWYGGGQTAYNAWPLEEGQVKNSAFVTGTTPDKEWANVLQRYFINSRGVAIVVDDSTPLYISVNTSNPKQFCLQARHDDFAYVYHATRLPQLNYSICASTDMKALHSFLADKSLWDGVKEEDLKVMNSLLMEPVWQLAAASSEQLTEAAVVNHTEDVIALGFPAGHVLLNEMWQPSVGDLALDQDRFPTMVETINIIHRRGFRIVLTVQPFISTESKNFRVAVKEKLLVTERGSEIPALTRYKSVLSAGVLDITRNVSAEWLHGKLKSLVHKYNVDAFYLDLGSAYDMPHYYQFENELTNLDKYKTIFTDSIFNSVGRVIGVSSAIKRPRPPIFVSLPSVPSAWQSLQTIIPATLTYGIIGYPFLMPGPVGGECELSVNLPERELYIRWLQLATFMPVMVYRYLPSQYDPEVLRLARQLAELRQTHVNPLLTKYAKDALNSGLPMVRPLWMVEPDDAACHSVVDEFSLGEQLIVAPILQAGAREREVYLPAGVWKDGIDGSLRKGNRWIHNYKVPLEKVAYFIKLPDNTRF